MGRLRWQDKMLLWDSCRRLRRGYSLWESSWLVPKQVISTGTLVMPLSPHTPAALCSPRCHPLQPAPRTNQTIPFGESL